MAALLHCRHVVGSSHAWDVGANLEVRHFILVLYSKFRLVTTTWQDFSFLQSLFRHERLLGIGHALDSAILLVSDLVGSTFVELVVVLKQLLILRIKVGLPSFVEV